MTHCSCFFLNNEQKSGQNVPFSLLALMLLFYSERPIYRQLKEILFPLFPAEMGEIFYFLFPLKFPCPLLHFAAHNVLVYCFSIAVVHRNCAGARRGAMSYLIVRLKIMSMCPDKLPESII